MTRTVCRKELERRAQMWAQGLSTKQMAEECCVSVYAINAYVRTHRDEFPYRQPTSSLDERERARRMRAEGMTYKAIGAKLGRDTSTVWHWCNDGRI